MRRRLNRARAVLSRGRAGSLGARQAGDLAPRISESQAGRGPGRARQRLPPLTGGRSGSGSWSPFFQRSVRNWTGRHLPAVFGLCLPSVFLALGWDGLSGGRPPPPASPPALGVGEAGAGAPGGSECCRPPWEVLGGKTNRPCPLEELPQMGVGKHVGSRPEGECRLAPLGGSRLSSGGRGVCVCGGLVGEIAPGGVKQRALCAGREWTSCCRETGEVATLRLDCGRTPCIRRELHLLFCFAFLWAAQG